LIKIQRFCNLVKAYFQPIEELLLRELPQVENKYPSMWGVRRHVGRLVRNILMSELLYVRFRSHEATTCIEV
jgi:hypothetical protein